MSKTSQSTNFRTVDIDALDEDKFQDDKNEVQSAAGPSDADVQNLLNSKKNSEALKLILNSPPYSADAGEKSRLFQLVIRVLGQYKTNEIDATVKQLSQTEQDTLLKYIYRGFSEPTDNTCGTLLNWHEKVYAATGAGGIMRVLTNRKAL